MGKEYLEAVHCDPAYLTSMQSTSCKMLGLDEAQAGIKTAGRNINNLIYSDDTTPSAESEEGLKRLLMKTKESVKNWLKTQHSKNDDHGIRFHHFMAIRWETMEIVTDFIILGSKTTADGDFSHEIKRCLLLGR